MTITLGLALLTYGASVGSLTFALILALLTFERTVYDQASNVRDASIATVYQYKEPEVEILPVQPSYTYCQAITRKGTRCTRKAVNGHTCTQHTAK